MKSHRRRPAFDTLERLTMLSTIQPGIAHHSLEAHRAAVKLPVFVRAVEQAAERTGSHVSVKPIEAVPGAFTVYQITFQTRSQTYTTDITITYPTKPGPQPG